jgi:hypothetical protein
MMKAVLTALALGAGVFLVSPQTASAAPLGLQRAAAPADSAVEKVHGRRHWHHHRHRHWNHGHHSYRYRHHRHHHWRRHYQAGPYFGFSFGPAWGYGHRHYHHRRWH